MEEQLLEVKNLRTSFFTHVGEVKAIRDVSFSIRKGEAVGIVGRIRERQERNLPFHHAASASG